MLPEPFEYPFRGERGLDTVLLGGGLHLASVFVPVLPLIPVLGYLLAGLESVATTDRETRFDAPPVPNVRSMIRSGVGGVFVVMIFLLPSIAVLLITVLGASTVSLAPESISVGTSLGFVVGSTTSLMLAAGLVYLLPAALVNYARTGRLRTSFDRDFLFRAAFHGEYFYNVVTGLVVGATLLVLSSALLGLVVGFFLAFYAELVMVGYWGGGLATVLERE